MSYSLPLFKIYWDDDDVANVAEVIKSGMNWATGPNITLFEDMVANYVDRKYCVAFNSGTSALYAALASHRFGDGDEVIVPSFTMIATANAPLFTGAKPVFADIEEATFGLDPEDVKERITNKTKAIIPIHYGGCSCRINELREIADDHNITLIEDAAEALGATVHHQKVGSFGASAMFSFCAPKVITTGEGGVIVTDSKDIYETLKLVRSHGRLDTQDDFASAEYQGYVALGYNFRLSNIAAALGISQIKKIDKIIGLRRANAAYLIKALAKIKAIGLPVAPHDYWHIYQMFTIRVPFIRDSLQEHLNGKNITTRVYFEPVHLTHFYSKVLSYRCRLPTTERVAKEVLTLPMYPTLSSGEIDYLASTIAEFCDANLAC